MKTNCTFQLCREKEIEKAILRILGSSTFSHSLEQKVTVQHVTVGEGGQAIVGNVTQGRREAAPDKAVAPPLALTDAKTAPMPTIESKSQVPISVPRTSKKK